MRSLQVGYKLIQKLECRHDANVYVHHVIAVSSTCLYTSRPICQTGHFCKSDNQSEILFEVFPQVFNTGGGISHLAFFFFFLQIDGFD